MRRILACLCPVTGLARLIRDAEKAGWEATRPRYSYPRRGKARAEGMEISPKTKKQDDTCHPVSYGPRHEAVAEKTNSSDKRAKSAAGYIPGQGRAIRIGTRVCPARALAQLFAQDHGIGPGNSLGGHHIRQAVAAGKAKADISAAIQINSTAQPIHQKMQRIKACFRHDWHQPPVAV